MTVADVMPRVEKGAAWLDANKPGWFARINTRQLEMADCARCVLGQTFGSYVVAISRFAPQRGRLGSPCWWAIERGFAIDSRRMSFDDVDIAWQPIREAWITVILERQFAAHDTPSQSQPVPVEVEK